MKEDFETSWDGFESSKLWKIRNYEVGKQVSKDVKVKKVAMVSKLNGKEHFDIMP